MTESTQAQGCTHVYGEEILKKYISKPNLEGQGGFNRKMVGFFKGSLVRVIVPYSGMQPQTHLRRYGVLSYKVVITSIPLHMHYLDILKGDGGFLW